MQYVAVVIYLLAAHLGLVFIKLGTSNTIFNVTGKLFHITISPFMVLGIFLYATSFLSYIYLLSKFNLSYIMPIMTGLSYFIVLAFSVFLLHEKVSVLQIIGIMVIFGGVVLMNIK